MSYCINCYKETTQEIWPEYPMCVECGKKLSLSLFQLYHNEDEVGLLRALEMLKTSKTKVGNYD